MPRHPSQRWRCVSGFSYLIGTAAVLLLLYIHIRLVHHIGYIIGPELAVLITYPFLILAIPILFFAFGNHRMDRFIGELSYPIYLLHYFVIIVVATLLANFGTQKGLGLISAIASIILAAFFYWTFIARLDKKRHFLTIKNPNLPNAAKSSLGHGGADAAPLS
jgi:peptidoglycan/LPS O-acetylase OafA/YrhL